MEMCEWECSDLPNPVIPTRADPRESMIYDDGESDGQQKTPLELITVMAASKERRPRCATHERQSRRLKAT